MSCSSKVWSDEAVSSGKSCPHNSNNSYSLHKHFIRTLQDHEIQVPYETKKINWQGGGKKLTLLTNNLENGGCGRQNEFQPFSTTPVNGSLSNYYGLCLLEERKNLGQCRVRFVLSQESFSWRIHCLRWTGGVCPLC